MRKSHELLTQSIDIYILSLVQSIITPAVMAVVSLDAMLEAVIICPISCLCLIVGHKQPAATVEHTSACNERRCASHDTLDERERP